MPCIVYSTLDVASLNIAEAVKARMDFEETKPIERASSISLRSMST